jgi:putative copper resistance protein D
VTVVGRPLPAAVDGRRAPALAAVGVGGLLVVALAAAPVEVAVAGARFAVRVAALGTVGALLYAAVLRTAPPPASSRRALRAASLWATVWAATTAIHALLTLTQLVGGAVTVAALRTFATDLAAGRAAVVVLALAVVVAAAARRCRTAGGARALLAVAVAGLVVPVVLTGHSATADDHVLAVTNLGVHVVAASVWIGGLLALLVHGRDEPAPAAARFSAVALGCFMATAASGLLAAWLVLSDAGGPAAVLGSGYGWLLLAKTAALVVLGVFGLQHRRRTLPRLRAGHPGSFRRFAVAEMGVMLATVALAVALSASPPPAAAAPAPGPTAPTVSAGAEAMAGHDHGELSVTVLIDETRFHVAGPVEAGARVTVHNATATEVTITADDDSFDVVVPGHALITFEAPDEPGTYRFGSRHAASFTDVLVVR